MNIGILGLGLIGGTIAKSLKKHYFISAFDISKESIKYALDNNIIDKAYDNISDFFADNRIIYICLYPGLIPKFLQNNNKYLLKSNILIETSGIKTHLVNQIKNINLYGADIIFTHPIAGSEKIGVYNSDKNIFNNANYVITPTLNNKEENIVLAKTLAKKMGFKNISLLTPKEHDEIISYTSQLTHILSLSLVNSISTNLDTKKYIGDSYRDLTRISIINEKLWPELFLYNKVALLKKINAFEIELNNFKKAIESNDNKKLEELMIKSTKIRKNMERDDLDES